VTAVALVAGGGVQTAVRLGLSMALLQFAIGALNDIIDAPADAARTPPKPIPGGSVSVTQARWIVAGAATAGLALAAPSGPVVVGLALVVLSIGATYDALAKGTPWSWLPFAVGIPLLPVYGWIGAAGTMPGFFALLLPMAVAAGAGLAIANARADLGADRAAGTRSVATALGAERAWWVGVACMTLATGIGVIAADRTGWQPVAVVLVVAGTAVVAIGLLAGRRADAGTQRRAWEAQAVGAAIAATGWVAGMVPGP
jgi:4-hydroxybenzoate polyprenyltransferase